MTDANKALYLLTNLGALSASKICIIVVWISVPATFWAGFSASHRDPSLSVIITPMTCIAGILMVQGIVLGGVEGE